MPLPKNFFVIEKEGKPLKYGINEDGNGRHINVYAPRAVVEPTNTKNDDHLVIIKRTGLKSWGINDSKLFPKQSDIDGSAIGIAILNKKHELLAIALGRGNTGATGAVFDYNGNLTIGNILHNDGSITELPKNARIEIDIERSDGRTRVEQKTADSLSEIVNKIVEEHKTNIAKARQAVDNNIHLPDHSMERNTLVVPRNKSPQNLKER